MAPGLIDQEAVVARGVVVNPTLELFAFQVKGLDPALDPEREVDDKIDVTGTLDDADCIPATDAPWKRDNDRL